MSVRRYDITVYRMDGSVRLWAYGIPESDAREMLWVAVRENTSEADELCTQFVNRVEVRQSA